MKDIARNAARKAILIAPSRDQIQENLVTAIIQAAIEKATRELSRKCFDLTEENAELRSQL